MDNGKIYLRIETPFSLKNRRTLGFFLRGIISVVLISAAVVTLYQLPNEDPGVPKMFLGFAIFWLIMGFIPTNLLLFNAYARIEDGELIVNALGFAEKHYPCGTAKKAVKKGGYTVIYGDNKPLVSILNGEAADDLVRSLRIPVETSTQK